MPERNAKSISLIHSGIHFEAQLSPDVRHNRVRLFWQSPMSKLIEELMPIRHQQYSSDEGGEIAPAEMRFCREADDVYSVEFLDPDTISKDAENADEEQTGAVPRREGTRRTVISTRIERDPQNRIDAIRIHGHRCVACGFDFGEAYGSRGEGYIEVHHLTPLAEVEEDHFVNPESDLAPVCANCHRMIHRRRGETLSLGELKEMIRTKTTD